MQNSEFEISIIIPTYNRGNILKMCLDALAGQTVPSDYFEVIVSDDGSQDNTREVTESFATGKLKNVKYLRQPNRGASAARNLAIRESKGRFLLIINDDTIATEKLVEEHLLVHRLHPEEIFAVLGRVTISEEVPPSIFARLHLDASFKTVDGQVELDWRAFITCNLSVKKSFLLRHELFEEKMRVLHEDLELGERLSHHGLKIIYRPEALGYHYHYIDENNFLSSAKQEGKSLAVWYKKSPHLKKELASLGFYLTMPLYKRPRYVVADLLINRLTISVFLPLARRLAHTHEGLSLKLYLKIYQSLKRVAIRNELYKRGISNNAAK